MNIGKVPRVASGAPILRVLAGFFQSWKNFCEARIEQHKAISGSVSGTMLGGTLIGLSWAKFVCLSDKIAWQVPTRI